MPLGFSVLCVATLPHLGEVESRAKLDPGPLGEAGLSSLGLHCHTESLWAGTGPGRWGTDSTALSTSFQPHRLSVLRTRGLRQVPDNGLGWKGQPGWHVGLFGDKLNTPRSGADSSPCGLCLLTP